MGHFAVEIAEHMHMMTNIAAPRSDQTSWFIVFIADNTDNVSSSTNPVVISDDASENNTNVGIDSLIVGDRVLHSCAHESFKFYRSHAVPSNHFAKVVQCRINDQAIEKSFSLY
jgi:hypothetical protein